MHTEYSRIRNRFVTQPDKAKADSSPDYKTFLVLPAILLFLLTTVGCGGAHPYSIPNPNPKSFTQVFVTANSQQIDLVGGTLLLHAAEQSQSASGEITYNDVTNAADWSASAAAVATVDKGVVTGTGIGHTTISATFDGLSDPLQIFAGEKNTCLTQKTKEPT